MRKKQRATSGFTIIEVMIVLAIAGLIMLIVFLAVPALQRSARNTERKHDAGTLAASLSQFIGNHNGQMPNSLRTDPNTPTQADIGNSSNLNSYETSSFIYYNVSNDVVWGSDAGPDTTGYGVVTSGTPVTTPTTPSIISLTNNKTTYQAINTETISVIMGESCNDSNTAAGPLISNTVAIFYVLETGSGPGTMKCLEI